MLHIDNFKNTLKIINNFKIRGLQDSFQVSIYYKKNRLNMFGGKALSDSKFRWFSSGKPITALAVAKLIEKKLLNYEEYISRFLPTFEGSKKNITVLNVLNHTIGLSDAENANKLDSEEKIIEYICSSAQLSDWENGRRAAYQPTAGWHILKKIIEVITNEKYDDYVTDNILKPLSMYGTKTFGEPDIITMNTQKIPNEESYPRIPRNFPKPGSSFIGPSKDLLKMYEMLLNKGIYNNTRILEETTINKLISSQRGIIYDETFQYPMDWGLGIMINNSENKLKMPYGYGKFASELAFGHGGIQSSVGFADPKYQLAIVIILDGQPGESLHNQRIRSIIESIYQELGIT
tara:strand:+ start:6019 stop:7062 length:1044 start_codon:yes stop_codon:yes gene_type:complete